MHALPWSPPTQKTCLQADRSTHRPPPPPPPPHLHVLLRPALIAQRPLSPRRLHPRGDHGRPGHGVTRLGHGDVNAVQHVPYALARHLHLDPVVEQPLARDLLHLHHTLLVQGAHLHQDHLVVFGIRQGQAWAGGRGGRGGGEERGCGRGSRQGVGEGGGGGEGEGGEREAGAADKGVRGGSPQVQASGVTLGFTRPTDKPVKK